MQYLLKLKGLDYSNKKKKRRKTDGENSLKFGKVENLSFHNFCDKLNWNSQLPSILFTQDLFWPSAVAKC